jgi:hypothetical protein
MNQYLIAAGILALIVGAVHSFLGEWLIFRHMRRESRLPSSGGKPLRETHARILWATWHIATAMGWGSAAILFWLAQPSSAPVIRSTVTFAIGASMLASAVLVLVGTKGRHPGWAGLLGVAILTALGAYA